MSTPPPWHTLGHEATSAMLETSAYGLTTDQAGDRLRRFGPNAIEDEHRTTQLEMVANQFRSPLILLLLAAAMIMLAIGEAVDALAVMLVVVINAAIGFAQERQAEESVQALRALLSSSARVMRDGRETEIDSLQIVPGDLVLLESGTRVPADLRLTTTPGLLVDESLLTGESDAVRKQPEPLPPDVQLGDRNNMAFAGTTAVRGRGRGFVVATGDLTELGAIAGEMRQVEQRQTPLQLRLDHLARVVGIVVASSAVLAFIAGVLAGRSTSEMFLVAVAVAVAAVPEGLPIAFTITLAVGVRRMAGQNAIVRRLPVVETLGSTTVIGSDKTGTLTENRMTVRMIWAAGKTLEIPAPGEQDLVERRGLLRISELSPVELTALSGVLTNEATASRVDGDLQLAGDPTESALLVAAMSIGIDPASARYQYPVLTDIPFEPERAFSASVRMIEGQLVLFVKGSPERILEASRRMHCQTGDCPVDRHLIIQAAQSMASEGQRVLGMAYRPVLPDAVIDPESVPDGLVFLGLAGMTDPARPGAPDAIATCHAAGVRTIMITGDHRGTANAIAGELGLNSSDDAVLTGAELTALTPAEVDQAVLDVDVFARVSPEQKLEIVQALQRNGEVVAVTGDGVNDAPALRSADIGVAMGKRGTDVAREASDMVLADDDFSTIVSAIEEGRKTYDNVRKVVSFLFTTNAAEVLIIITALLLDWPLLMIAVQILWLNLVTDSLQVMALAFEPAEPDVMTRPPLGRHAGILTRALWQRVGLSGLVMTIGTLALFRWELERGAEVQTAQTVALTTLVLYQMFQAFNSRSATQSLLKLPALGNPFLVFAVIASILIHAGALYLPATQYLLRVEPLSAAQWGLAVTVAASILVTVEIHKALVRMSA
jgi:Ca2+-transporting ATPase